MCRKTSEFFVVPGAEICSDKRKSFGKSLAATSNTINYGPLKPYKDNWKEFDSPL